MDKWKHLTLLWILLLKCNEVISSVNLCRSQLLEGCFCGKYYLEHQEQFVVNCTNMNFNNTDMLKDLPEETQVLIFTGNNIPELPWNIFGEFEELSMLRVIDMSNNRIRNIKGKTYHHVSNVERLILNHNNLTVSSDDGNYHHPRVFSNFINLQELHLTNAFADNTDAALANDLHDIFVNSNLTKLYKLHLEQNEIKSFKDRNVFCDLPNLRQLYLGDNYLNSLSFNLECLKKLEFLDLEHNNITKFTQNELDSFDKLAPPYRDVSLMIDLKNNPFRCDSAVNRIYYWLQKTNVSVRNRDQVECVSARLGHSRILSLKTVAEHRNAKISRGIVVLLVVLSLILVSLLSAYVYLSRSQIKQKLSPLFDAVTRKVQYTTIESQEV